MIAVTGVLNPNPTLRVHLSWPAFFVKAFLYPRKTVGCFWNERSVWSSADDAAEASAIAPGIVEARVVFGVSEWHILPVEEK